MFKTVCLESTKYWNQVAEQRHHDERRQRAKAALERFTFFAVFAVCATGLAIAFACGVFDNIDVAGAVRKTLGALKF